MADHVVGNINSQHFARIAKLPKHPLLMIISVVKMVLVLVMKMVMMVSVMTMVMMMIELVMVRSSLCYCYRSFPSTTAKVK